MVSKLIIDEQPLLVLPALAVEVGLNEAIVLQQIHYWLSKSKHEHDGRTWIYNSINEWCKQFPFWSEKTIRRTLSSLEKQGILLKGNYNKLKIDRTLWYSIDYEVLHSIEKKHNHVVKKDIPSGQNDQMKCGQNDQTNTREYTEITTDNILSFYKDVIDYLNEICNTKYRHTTSKTQSLIKARKKEGFTLEDFKQVIDNKFETWEGTEYEKYLRPETLFGTKFESYLNEQRKKKEATSKSSKQYINLEDIDIWGDGT